MNRWRWRADIPTVTEESTIPELLLEGFTTLERTLLLPELGAAIDQAGGWLLRKQTLSATTAELHIEVQGVALTEVYGALLAHGLELTRTSHRMLTERCTCALHLARQPGLSSLLTLRVLVHFLSEPTRPSDVTRLLVTGAAAA